MLFSFALKAIHHAWIILDLLGQEGFKIAFNRLQICQFFIRIGSHANRTDSIDSIDRRGTTSRFKISHLGERYFNPLRGSDHHPVQGIQGLTLAGRIAHQHLDLIPATQQSLHLKTEERLTHLSGQVSQIQPQHLRGRFEL